MGKDGASWDKLSSFCQMNTSQYSNTPPFNWMKVVFVTDMYKNDTGFSAYIYNGEHMFLYINHHYMAIFRMWRHTN